MDPVQKVVLRTNEYHFTGKVDQIEVFICDQWLRRDIVSERCISLAQRLADGYGVALEDYRNGKV